MTTAIERSATAPIGIVPWRVARELAVVDAVRLARNPATLIGAALALGMMAMVHWGEAPVWPRVSIGVSISLAVFGFGAALAVADMSHRSWHTDDSEGIDVLPASPRIRTAGHLGAALALVAMAGLLEVVYIVYTSTQQPVGRMAVWEVAAGPASVLVMVTVGLAAGRWFPSPVTGPVTVLALIGVNALLGMVGALSWLSLIPRWDMLSSMEGPPPELSFRPMAQHVGYLIAVAAFFAALSFLHGKWDSSSILIAAAVLGSAALVFVLGWLNLRTPSQGMADGRVSQYLGSEASYICEKRGLVTYCAYPGYEEWIKEWAAAVEPVVSRLPEEVMAPLEVRQYPVRWMDVLQVGDSDLYGPSFPYLGEDIRTGLWWGRGPGGLETESYPFGMALGTAAWAVGLPTAPPVTSAEDPWYSSCWVNDQARGIIAVWLAGQASDTTHAHIHNVLEEYQQHFPGRFEEPYGWIGAHQAYSSYRSAFSLVHFRYADQLLHRQRDEVTDLIHRHWGSLVNSRTTFKDAEVLLDLNQINWVSTGSEASAGDSCP